MEYFGTFQHIQKSRNDPLETAKVPFSLQSARYEWKASASSQLLLVDSDLSFFSSISASNRVQERIILVERL
jgi:hypothetical protein